MDSFKGKSVKELQKYLRDRGVVTARYLKAGLLELCIAAEQLGLKLIQMDWLRTDMKLFPVSWGLRVVNLKYPHYWLIILPILEYCHYSAYLIFIITWSALLITPMELFEMSRKWKPTLWPKMAMFEQSWLPLMLDMMDTMQYWAKWNPGLRRKIQSQNFTIILSG